MTAFGRSQVKADWGTAIWELRSVNHRYLEITVRLPEILRELEQKIREILHNSIQRGKIECNLRFQAGSHLGKLFTINQHLLSQLIKASREISDSLPEKSMISVTDLLSWNGVLTEDEASYATVNDKIIQLFENAVNDLVLAREREGKVLRDLILNRVESINVQVEQVRKRLPMILQKQQEKILSRLAEAKLQLDQQRLEQEMVYLAQKIDVAEELDRLQSHTEEVKRILNVDKSTGRRLDFMMQELNREANTLAAKSIDADVTHSAVEMKVLIEQIREQVNNIE